jgi:hypothetical protein
MYYTPGATDYRQPTLSPAASKFVETYAALSGPELMKQRGREGTRLFCSRGGLEKAECLDRLAAIDEVLHLRAKNLRKRAGGVRRDEIADLIRRVEILEAALAAVVQG